jgi:hypothetical protein
VLELNQMLQNCVAEAPRRSYVAQNDQDDLT